MNLSQRTLGLCCQRNRVPLAPDEPTPSHRQVRLAALLRRQAAKVSDDVMNCPGPALPHHLARLRDLRETMTLAVEGAGLIPDEQRQRSDRQLLHPATVADWLAALEIVARTHRAPAWVNSQGAALDAIHRKLDTLAAMVARRPGAEAAWANLEAEGEQ